MRNWIVSLLVCPLTIGLVAQQVIGPGRIPDLDQEVSISSAQGGTPLPVFMSNVAALTGISTHVSSGRDVTVRGTFDRVPLRRLLVLCSVNTRFPFHLLICAATDTNRPAGNK